MCEHLQPLEDELHRLGVKETYRGQPWSENCREWVYYDCYFDYVSLHMRLHLPDCVQFHHNDDPRSGTEEGFYCTLCHDGIIGLHRAFPSKDTRITVS